jgi:3-oxoacyl-[acyl-carrier protein] reductase
MMRRLDGKVAIITGAGQGIGRAIAQVFAREGARVAVATRTPKHGEDTVRLITEVGGQAYFYPVDLADAKAGHALVDEVVAGFKQLDILVHNAGIVSNNRIEAMDDAVLDLIFSVNLRACFTLSRAAIPHLRKAGAGRILITSSVMGPRVTMPGLAHYAATKGGVNAFIRTAALELAADGITVNGVEPGYVDTTALDRFEARHGESNIAKYIPAGRLGRPEEVANAMLFLASAEASYITGQTIIVDGGSTLPESPVFVGA